MGKITGRQHMLDVDVCLILHVLTVPAVKTRDVRAVQPTETSVWTVCIGTAAEKRNGYLDQILRIDNKLLTLSPLCS